MTRYPTGIKNLVVVLVVALSVAACGGDDTDVAAEPAPSTTTSELPTSAEDAEPTEGADGTEAEPESNGEGGDAVERAQGEVDAYIGIPVWEAPGPPFDASNASGKVIFNIPISSALPFIEGIDQGMMEVAAIAGVEFVNCPNQGQVAEWVRCFNQGISRNADLIILDAAPNPAQLQPQIKAAQAAGVPVMATHMPLNSEFPPGTLPPENVANVTAVVPGPFPKSSQLTADYAIANTPDAEVHALIITSNEVAASKGIVEMTQAEFERLCPDTCKTTVVNVPLVDWATKIQSEVQSALLRDPSINWVIPIYDSMSQFAEPAIRAAGRTEDVQISTFNGTPFVLKMIQDGDIVAMDVGESLNWLGWAFMDQALRVLAGEEPIDFDTAPTPLRVWDDSNIDEAGTPPKSSVGYGDEYQERYLELWELSGD